MPETGRPTDAAADADDEAAYTALFEEHVDAIWNHAYRLTGSATGADDITANTFAIAWRKRRTIDIRERDPRPWLFTVAGNLARSEFRSRGRFRRALTRIGRPETQVDHADDVVIAVDAQQHVSRIAEAVQNLPRAQRKAVELCLVADLDAAQAAAALGTAESTVRANLSRARSNLREALKEYDR